MPLVFEVFFLISVIIRIESIGGGWVGGRGVGWVVGRVGSHRRGKANIQTQAKGSALPSVNDQTGTTHRVGQTCRQNQFGTPSSLIDAPQGPQRPGKAPSWFDSIGKKQTRPSSLKCLVSLNSACVWLSSTGKK